MPEHQKAPLPCGAAICTQLPLDQDTSASVIRAVDGVRGLHHGGWRPRGRDSVGLLLTCPVQRDIGQWKSLVRTRPWPACLVALGSTCILSATESRWLVFIREQTEHLRGGKIVQVTVCKLSGGGKETASE